MHRDEDEKDSKSLRSIMLHELADLFLFCPPGRLRRSIEDVFFNYLIDAKGFEVEEKKELVSNIYHLINFLNEAETLNQIRT